MAIRHFMSTTFLRFGISIGRASDVDDVRALVKELHPVLTDIPLIRLGSDGDGGYLVPDDLDGISACFSPGVDDRASFESDMIARGIPCFLADASVEASPITGDHIHFTRKFLGVVNDDQTITMEDWINHHAPGSSDLILQMDIEGAEWYVLIITPLETIKRFRQIILEIHDLDQLTNKRVLPLLRALFEKLLPHYHVVHNHPNNYGGIVKLKELHIPRVMELTLLRKDRAEMVGYADTFPHPLDRQNDLANVDVILPREWRHG